ncbi:hypothetical protein FB451DRAFT_1387713 [Mycena latifolia]|nr:hypothetical protein FB451DRAFT_1387713 [Mycena latifolia]
MGAGTAAATAIDFLKDVRLGFTGHGATDTEELEEVGDRFRHGSPADTWFKSKTFTTWKDFVKAFEERFAGMVPVAKPRDQLLAELAGMRIAIGELAVDHVLVDGVQIAPMVEFRAQLKEAVLDAGAGQEKEGVWAFHASLSAAVKLSIGSAPANWDGVLTVLGNVPQNVIDQEVEEYRRKSAFDAALKELNSMMHRVRVMPVVPAAPAAAATKASNVTAPVMENPPNGDQHGGESRGDRRGRACLRQIMIDGNARQPKDDAEGCVRYTTQVADWARRNGHIPADAVSIWSTGYPISPGTAFPCSGECWRCGVVTQPVHRACPKPLVPVLEHKYRVTCGTWFGCLHFPNPAVNYVEVTEVEGVPWYGGEETETQSQDPAKLVARVFHLREKTSVPFMHWMSFGGPKGEKVRVMGLLDTGAQVGAMDTVFYLSKAARLGKVSAATRLLQMANGKEVVPFRRWEGEIEVDGIRIEGTFDIFDSGGSWKVLLGKPLQAALGVVHNIKTDVVMLRIGERTATLVNQNPSVWTGGIRAAIEAARRCEGATHPTCVMTDLPTPCDFGTKEYPDWASCLPEMDNVRPGHLTLQLSLGHRVTVHWGRTTVLM